MYRFLLSRRWIVLLLLVIVFAVTCVELGFWQLRRLDQKKALNTAIISHTHMPVAPVETVLGQGGPTAALYRRVSATGRYDVSQEILLSGRAVNDRPGYDALTPLKLADGRALIVNRGFVPLNINTPGASQARPPAGTVTVTGILLPTETKGLFGQTIPGGHLSTIVRIEIPRIGEQVPYAVLPVYMLLADQRPAQPGTLPQPESYMPDLSNGPHLSYAIQWYSFATVAVVGFFFLAWRTAHGKQRTSPEPV
ncbi:MAG TPA: SURF1 family protein [Actinomycetota bacterium]|nr:SURF1 family protein [Actinomycetota bacterium]